MQQRLHLASCVTEHSVDEYTIIGTFLHGLADDTARTYMFREELRTPNQAIALVEQEDYSLRQFRATLSTYCPPRRQDNGGPEPMNLCYVESERPRTQNHKRSAR